MKSAFVHLKQPAHSHKHSLQHVQSVANCEALSRSVRNLGRVSASRLLHQVYRTNMACTVRKYVSVHLPLGLPRKVWSLGVEPRFWRKVLRFGCHLFNAGEHSQEVACERNERLQRCAVRERMTTVSH